MLTAYMDASGKDGRSSVLVVCGYLAEKEQWDAFQLEWREMLPNGEVFHMTDLMALQGSFSRDKGWDEKRRNGLLEKAFKIITSRTIYGVTGIVNIAACESHFPVGKKKRPKARGRRKYSEEYAIAGLSCVIGISRSAKRRGYSEPIKYIFEVGDDGYAQVERALARAYANEQERNDYLIGGWGVEDKERVCQLHPADILAQQIRHASLNVDKSEDLNLQSDVLSGLIRSQDRYFYIYDQQNLPTLKSLADQEG